MTATDLGVFHPFALIEAERQVQNFADNFVAAFSETFRLFPQPCRVCQDHQEQVLLLARSTWLLAKVLALGLPAFALADQLCSGEDFENCQKQGAESCP